MPQHEVCVRRNHAFAGAMPLQALPSQYVCIRTGVAFANVIHAQGSHLRKTYEIARTVPSQVTHIHTKNAFAIFMCCKSSALASVILFRRGTHSQELCPYKKVCLRRLLKGYVFAGTMYLQEVCFRKQYALAGLKPAQEMCIRRNCLHGRCVVCKRCAFA